MTTHLGVMILFAACVSVVFGTLLRETPRDELRMAARIFSALVVGAYALGWVMYLAFG
jgi:undecaprenyl pyrophosphate phosphatase UppP